MSNRLSDSGDSAQPWTSQLKLLRRVYGAALREITNARRHTLAGDAAARAKSILRAERLILEIIAGLDPSYGEIPAQVEQLCFFCLYCLDRGGADLSAAEQVLSILADGFDEIADAVGDLERNGGLPARQTERQIVDQVI